MTQLYPRQTIYTPPATSLTVIGDLIKFNPARPIVVTDWGVVFTTTCTGTNGKITCNLRPTAGSTAGQTVGLSSSFTTNTGQSAFTDTAGGQMTLTGGGAGFAAGKEASHVVFPEPSTGGLAVFGTTGNQGGGTGQPGNNPPGTGLVSSTANQGLLVLPGQEVALNLGTAMGTAGAGTAYITFYELPLAGDATITGTLNDIANTSFVQS